MSVDRVYRNPSALPDGFLSGSAPRSQEITLNDVPFPASPTLLSSDLVVFRLENIFQLGHVSPEAMVVGLASLTRFETLQIDLRAPCYDTDRIRLPPEMREALPALTSFKFEGPCEYLEVLVSRIRVDSPQLDRHNDKISLGS